MDAVIFSLNVDEFYARINLTERVHSDNNILKKWDQQNVKVAMQQVTGALLLFLVCLL